MNLLACPWCGAGGDSLRVGYDSKPSSYVVCEGCGAEGPRARWNDYEGRDSLEPKERAAELWNAGLRYPLPRLRSYADLLEAQAVELMRQVREIRLTPVGSAEEPTA